jgi:hypothetical protein
VKVRTTNSAVGDFDIDIILSPLFGLERTPLHLAIHRVRVVPPPTFELDISHGDERCVCECMRVYVNAGGKNENEVRQEVGIMRRVGRLVIYLSSTGNEYA